MGSPSSRARWPRRSSASRRRRSRARTPCATGSPRACPWPRRSVPTACSEAAGMLLAIDDLRDFDAHLRGRSKEVRARLREALSGHRLTLREARVHHVLMPMVGLYTPGWQALPAWSWGFVELVTNEGPVGTGEWSVAVD